MTVVVRGVRIIITMAIPIIIIIKSIQRLLCKVTTLLPVQQVPCGCVGAWPHHNGDCCFIGQRPLAGTAGEELCPSFVSPLHA